MPHIHPVLNRSYSSRDAQLDAQRSPTTVIAAPLPRTPAQPTMHVKRITLTSKKNWWMVEMDDQEDQDVASTLPSYSVANDESSPPLLLPPPPPPAGIVSQQLHHYHHKEYQIDHPQPVREVPSPPPSPIYRPPHQPTSIFSFPTPTAYSAPPNPTAHLDPFAHGSASEIFKCVVKKPDVIQLEINGEMQSNAKDVTVQFLAELRVYTTVSRHRNIAAFLGCLENVGMVLEYVEGRTLYEVVVMGEGGGGGRRRSSSSSSLKREEKIDYHDQLLDGLTHLHSYGLSHGDLSLLNVQVTVRANTIKLLDFGRSVASDSVFTSPEDEPEYPFVVHNTATASGTATPRAGGSGSSHPRLREQIQPGTRPFSAPEVLRGECEDPLLADAYSFGMILVCLDRGELVDCKPWEQRKDMLPKDLFDRCEVFEKRAREYLKKWSERRRLYRADMMMGS